MAMPARKVWGMTRLSFQSGAALHFLYRCAPSICAALLFLGFVLLWQNDRALYMALLHPYIWTDPTNPPFTDLSAVLLASDCWRQGVDVLQPNACMGGGMFNYSPLLLRLGLLGLGQGILLPGGVALSLAAIAACALLPPPLSRRELALRCLLLCSGAAAHAFECGNIDLAMFILVVSGLGLQRRYFIARLAGYGLFLLGGTLKFYPAVLLLLLLRESRRRVFCLGAGLALAAVLLLWHDWQALSGIFSTLPLGLPFRGSFGAINLPFGVILLGFMSRPSVLPGGAVFEAALHHPQLAALVVISSRFLFLCALLAGLKLAARHTVALAALDDGRRVFLAAGAVLLAFCFFTAPNYEYRGLFLLLTVPGLYAMGTPAARLMLALMPLLLWERVLWEVCGSIGTLLPGGLSAALGILLWLLREAAWWFIIIEFTAIAIAYARLATASLHRYGNIISAAPVEG